MIGILRDHFDLSRFLAVTVAFARKGQILMNEFWEPVHATRLNRFFSKSGKLKTLHCALTGQQLRPRAAVGLLVLGIGILLIILSMLTMVTIHGLSLNPAILGVMGVLLLVVGLFLLVTDLFVVWLSRGQTALVDGLQAG